jgi:two-component sensor histidine kinase/Flp pilus assembly protein TadD
MTSPFLFILVYTFSAMKRLILFWLLVGILTIGFSQHRSETDSLQEQLRKPTSYSPQTLTEIASRLGWLFYSRSRPDSAVYYYNYALSIPYKNSKIPWLANVHFGLGAAYAAMNRPDSSIFHYKKSLALFSSIDDRDNLAFTSINLSITYKNQGLYEEALQHAIAAIKILESRGESQSLAQCYNTTAIIFAKINDHTEAAAYYRKAIALFAKFDTTNLAKSYNNLGWHFVLTHQYDSARINLHRAADLKRRLNDTKGLARTINNLGKVSMLRGDLATATQELNESFSIEQQVNDPNGMIEVLNNLGELSLLTSDYKRSKNFLLEAEKIILLSATPEYLRQNLELQVRLAREQKDFANGMMLMDRFIVIRDSLLNNEKSKSLQAMHIRYETEKKEQQIALLQQKEEISMAKIKTSRIMIGALAVGLILVAAIGSLVYINLRNARAAKKRIELLLSETRHRIKNNLQTLASIFHLQTRHYTDQEMVLEAQSAESRVHAMSMLHERFYNADADHIINTRAYLTDLIHKLVDVYGLRTRDLRLTLHVDDIEMDIDKALALSLIIQELICNAFKYAFDHKPNPQLTVSIRLQGHEVVATVKDNGVGLSDSSIGTSQGFGLVDALVAQLDGKMEHHNLNGTTFVIRFVTTPWKKRLFS